MEGEDTVKIIFNGNKKGRKHTFAAFLNMVARGGLEPPTPAL